MGLSPDALYSAVVEDVKAFLPNGSVPFDRLAPDASYKQVAATLLVNSLLKKWLPSDTKEPDRLAYEKFLAANRRCKDWKFSPEWESDLELFGEFRRELDDFFHPMGGPLVESYYDILSQSRCGPGASLGSSHNSFYAKMFSSKMATTSTSLYTLYRNYHEWFPELHEAECLRREELGYPKIVDSSSMCFVPKTRDISRMICVEPSLNMYFQLGLGAILEGRLRDYFRIDLSTQPLENRRLAQVGSKTGQFSTIDLSSASDSVSLSLCRAVLPGWFYDILMDLRVPFTKYGNEKVRLEMISTMGNGFTFPLQTIIFSCLIRAAHRVSGVSILDGSRRNWSCFGDDLICDTKAYRNLVRLLSLTGFSVNGSKTFFEGPFRESCGTDWFFGRPVRGIYLKSLNTPQDTCVAINLLNEWSAYTGIPLIRGITYLMGGLRTSLYVPYSENMDSGIRVPSSFLKKEHFRYDSNGTMIYRAYESRPKYIFFEEKVIRYPRQVKRRDLIFNPSGLLISFIRGELVRGRISIRHDNMRYRTKLRCSLFWDYIDLNLFDGTRFSWQQWETAVLINFSNL
jgi:hypothetical protein